MISSEDTNSSLVSSSIAVLLASASFLRIRLFSLTALGWDLCTLPVVSSQCLSLMDSPRWIYFGFRSLMDDVAHAFAPI